MSDLVATFARCHRLALEASRIARVEAFVARAQQTKSGLTHSDMMTAVGLHARCPDDLADALTGLDSHSGEAAAVRRRFSSLRPASHPLTRRASGPRGTVAD